MKSDRILKLLLTLIFTACGRCYPSKPLNERSASWQAWLLVDQSHQKTDVEMLRRRITPKSVFLAPAFRPDALPPCADGYISDSMNRCVEIHKLNHDAFINFNFLLDKLNAQFLEEVAEQTTQGPLQVNIPLFDEENDTKVAIVVTPSIDSHRIKIDTTTIKTERGDKFQVEDVAAILGVKPEDVEVTTIADLSTTVAEETTTATLETTTALATTTESTTLAESTTIVPEEGEALFFRI